ncbi:MAG: amidohydrolase family protein [Chloroflexi bacterium]|nr:MAG: amidohydrolase family protein [Chloroflexota bacterium]
MLLRGARGVERRDRGRRRRWEDRAGLDELRAVVAPGAVEKRGEEGNVARGTQRAQLAETEAIGEDDKDLPHTLTKGHREITKWQRIALVAGAEDVQHCRGDVDETAAGVIREDEVARAETLEERVGHRRTILRAVRTVFELDGFFDGEHVVENAAIVVDGGEIAWAGERKALPKDSGEIAKPAGRFAVPGLINCHAHLTLDGEANFAAEVRQTDGLAMVKAFKNARASLYAGVTTVRDLGANGTMVIELGRAIERGVVEGPRIVAAGRGVTTTGGHGAEVGRVADGPDEVRKAVREQVRSGARVIKIFSTGGVLGEGAPPEVSQFTPEETAAAVAEAHNAGLRITTHAHGSGGMRVAAEAGIDSVEHATLLDERTVRLLKERDVAIIPTFAAIHSLLEHANVLDPVVIERTRAVADRHREGVRMAHRAGVRIAAGTDSGTPFNLHERFAVELELLTECGLSAEQALAAATSGSARVVGLEKAGHIGGGCWADLVFVDGDPIADVAVLLSPKTVYVRGAPVV